MERAIDTYPAIVTVLRETEAIERGFDIVVKMVRCWSFTSEKLGLALRMTKRRNLKLSDPQTSLSQTTLQQQFERDAMEIRHREYANWASIERRNGSCFTTASLEALVPRISAISGWDANCKYTRKKSTESVKSGRRIWSATC